MRIACVLKSGGDYHPWHVYALRDMCREWLPGLEFVCLTDVPALNCASVSLKHELKGWWSKLELFDAFHEGETMFMDLDTVVRGPCSQTLDSTLNHNFLILRDVYRGLKNPQAMQSSIMFWRGDYRWIFELFMTERPEGKLGSDQNFLEHAFKKTGIDVKYWQDFTPDICSFKAHIRDLMPPSNSAIVCFHGHPRPWKQSLIEYPKQGALHPR